MKDIIFGRWEIYYKLSKKLLKSQNWTINYKIMKQIENIEIELKELYKKRRMEYENSVIKKLQRTPTNFID